MGFVRDAGFGARVATLLVLAIVATVALGVTHTLSGRTSGSGSPGVSSSPTLSSASPSATPSRDPWGVVYPIVTKSGAVIGGTQTDVYLPLPGSAQRAPAPQPVVVLLAASGVSATQYEQLAHDLASYGTVVVVPPAERDGATVPAASRVASVRTWARAVVDDPDAPAHELVDPRRVLVLSHGARALSGRSPAGVDATVVYGDASPGTGRIGVPTMAVCGASNARSRSCAGASSGVDGVGVDGVDASVIVAGADAMAVTDEGRTGARSSGPIDPARETTIAVVAHWSALWLLAHAGVFTPSAFAQYAARAADARVQVVLHAT